MLSSSPRGRPRDSPGDGAAAARRRGFMCHASLCCLVYVSLSMNSLLSATRGASALFLIAGAKVRTFPLPAKHSDDFFQGGNTHGHARRWGRTPWDKKKNPGRETGGGTGGERRRKAHLIII